MRPAAFLRRTVALTAATALISGGLASGLLASPAYALVAATVTDVSPSSWDNRSTASFTVTGTGFLQNDVVVFHPCDVQPWTIKSTITGAICHTMTGATEHEVGDFSASATVPLGDDTTLVVRPNLALAPAGLYYLTVKHADNTSSVPTRDVNTGEPVVMVQIKDIGVASLRSIANGVSSSGGTCGDPTRLVDDCDRGAGALDLIGSNFAIGADIQFFNPSSGLPDPGLTFAPGNPGNGDNTIKTAPGGTGYPSATLIQGNYAVASDSPTTNSPGFVPGRHFARVVNTNVTGGLKASGGSVDFWQPWFRTDATSVDTPIGTANPPSAEVGVGAKDVAVTVKGRGIRPGARLTVQSGATGLPFTCAGITTGSSTVSAISPADVDGNDSKITAKINIASCTTPTGNAGTPRSVTITDPSGTSWTRTGQIRVNAAPKADATNFATLGQGARQRSFTVTGTGFAADTVNNPPTGCPTFDFGTGVTATTISCPSTSQATVQVDIAQDAPTGDRSVTVTNAADKGSSTTGPDPVDGAPLTINAGPKIKTLSPASITSNATDVVVTVTGTGFESDADGDMFVELLDPSDPTLQTFYPGIFVSNQTVTPADPIEGGDDTFTFKLTTTDAPTGQPILVLTNPGDQGRFACTCIGIDSLVVSPTTHNNIGSVTGMTLTGSTLDGSLHLGNSVGANSTVKLVKTVPVTGQVPIVGTALTKTGTDTARADFDLASVAPGAYNVVFVADSTSGSSAMWSCTGCFTVTSAPMTLTGITPNKGGQGATNLPVRVAGTHFSKGTTVTIDGVTIHGVTFVSSDAIDAKLDVPSDADVGAHTVTVNPGDGSAAKTTTFTVTAAPNPASVAPTALGAGAGTDGTTRAIKINGTHFQNDPATKVTVSGTGVTLTVTKITEDVPPNCTPAIPPATEPICLGGSAGFIDATVAVATSAAPGKRDITVTNADGGIGTLVGALTINPGPVALTVADPNGLPLLKPDGVKHAITITGGGYVTDNQTPNSATATQLAITKLDGTADSAITVENVVVVSSTKITADVTVATSAALDPRRISLTNPGDFGYGRCDTCAYVAKVPGPTTPKLTSLGKAIKVTWVQPATNGAPIMSYHLVLKDLVTAGTRKADVSGSTRSITFTNLVNGRKYEVALNALNAAGAGSVVKAQGYAGLATTLTLVRAKTLVPYGSPIYYSGKLTGTSSTGVVAPLKYRTLTLFFQPAKGNSLIRTVKTTSIGTWSYRATSGYNLKLTAKFAGDTSYRPVSRTATVLVSSRVLKSYPANYSKSSATTTLKITGSVAPNAAGKYVYLYRYTSTGRTLMAKATLGQYSTFLFSLKPPKGTYTFRVYMPATYDLYKRQLNYYGYSAAFTLYRT